MAAEDNDKLLNTLGELDTKIRDWQQSGDAKLKAAAEGLEAANTELKEQRKELADIKATHDKINRMPASKRESELAAGRALGENIRSIHQKAASIGTAADGGYLTDDDTHYNIRSAQNQYGVIRQVMGDAIVPMGDNTSTWPVDTFEDTAGNTPVPASTSENAAISESDDAVLDQVDLTASKIATLNYVSQELMDDSFIDFMGAYLLPKIGRQFGKLEDQTVLTASSTGLLNTANVLDVVMGSGRTTFADIIVDDLINMEDGVVDDALQEGQYLLHRTIVNQLRKVKDLDGQPILLRGLEQQPAQLNAYPFTKAGVMPTKSADPQAATSFILFGDLRLGCVVGERLQRRIAVSDQYRFNRDQLAVRVTERFAFATNANIGRAICRLKTATE